MTHAALKDHDPSKPSTEQGLYRKFDVFRTDLSDQPGGKHHGCEYFVLDLTHDPHAKAALAAYAVAVNKTHPLLAADLCQRYDLSAMEGEAEVVAWRDREASGKWQYGPRFDGDKPPSYPHEKLYSGPTRQAVEGMVLVPDGWAIVPLEPTEKMMIAGNYGSSLNINWHMTIERYKRQVAAAPQPPAHQPQQAGGDADMALVEEGLRYFDLAGDKGDKRYTAEIRKALAKLSPTPPQPEAGGGVTEALLRDLLPVVDAYEMAGRRSYYEDGVLHWEMTPQYWAAQRLRERLDAALSTTPASGGEHGQ